MIFNRKFWKIVKWLIADEHLTFVKTNGGFHCLVKLAGLKGNNTWYQKIQAHTFKSELNIMSNDLMPIVGCNQGKFIPYFFNETN